MSFALASDIFIVIVLLSNIPVGIYRYISTQGQGPPPWSWLIATGLITIGYFVGRSIR